MSAATREPIQHTISQYNGISIPLFAEMLYSRARRYTITMCLYIIDWVVEPAILPKFPRIHGTFCAFDTEFCLRDKPLPGHPPVFVCEEDYHYSGYKGARYHLVVSLGVARLHRGQVEVEVSFSLPRENRRRSSPLPKNCLARKFALFSL